MRKLKYSISRNALNQMYMSYLLPVVEYASVIWDGYSEQDFQTLSVSLENLSIECGWLTLSQRRQQNKHSFMYNVNAGLVPSYTSDLIPPLVSEISDYPLRNKQKTFLLLIIGLTFQRNHVYPHPFDYGMALKMNLKTTFKVSKVAKIRNRYNQVPHLTQDTNGKVTNSQKTPQTRAKRSALSQQVTTKHI